MEISVYNKFHNRIHAIAFKKKFPLRVMFEVTYRCNFKCKHCYVPQACKNVNKEINTSEVFLILDQLKNLGCFYLGFTGGEPFVRKDFLDILWYAKKTGFEIIIYTNGSMINKNTIRELSLLRPNKIDITIPAVNKNIFEDITGIKGSHRKVFDTIRLLHKNGINLGFKTSLLKNNRNEIEKIRKFSESLNVDYRFSEMLYPRLDSSRGPYDSIKKQYLSDSFSIQYDYINKHKKNIEFFNKKIDRNISYKSSLSKSKVFDCGAGFSQAAITPIGELKICILADFPKYKILKSSLKSCWKRLNSLTERIKAKINYPCKGCKLKKDCNWCPAKSWIVNKNFNSCPADIFLNNSINKSAQV